MEVEEDSKDYLALKIQKGLYQYNGLVFGIAIWQWTMSQAWQGIPKTKGTDKSEAPHCNS